MMDVFPFILFGILTLLGILMVVYVAWSQHGRKKVPERVVRRVRSEWKHMLSMSDPSRRVLEAEKVADGLLKDMGYPGSFGERLKAVGPRFKNIDKIWGAHKLRNRIAHETGINVSDREADRAVHTFAGILSSFGIRV